MADHGIESFELVVVNLYPFEAAVAKQGVTEAEAIENIDIGGPSLVRAAAKNFAFVTVATSPAQYAGILQQMAGGGTTLEFRRKLAGEAFAHTARYDQAIARFRRARAGQVRSPIPCRSTWPERSLCGTARTRTSKQPFMPCKTLHGEASFAPSRSTVRSSPTTTCSTWTGAGNRLRVRRAGRLGNQAQQSLRRRRGRRLGRGPPPRHGRRPAQRFGSVLGLNRTVDAATAEVLCRPGLFIEAIAAPDFDRAAVEMLTTRPRWKNNVRLMKAGPLEAARGRLSYRHIHGGMLLQEADVLADPQSEWKVVTEKGPTPEQWADLRFAFAIVRYVKSNAIAVCRDRMLLGAGAGQMSRVDSVEIARKRPATATGRGSFERCVLPLPRFDRTGRQGPYCRHHPARRLGQGPGRDRRLQPRRHSDGLHGQAAFQALGQCIRHTPCAACQRHTECAGYI